MYKKKPYFIVFEGVEGCGKSFQSKKLYLNLRKNFSTILTREPGVHLILQPKEGI